MLRGDANCENSSTIIEKTLASAQYPTVAYRPRFEYTYEEPEVIDGVYYIYNNGAACPIEVENGKIANHTSVQTSEVGDFFPERLQKMWKVERIPNSVYYVIRPYMKLDMALHIRGHYADIYTIGTSNESINVPDHSRWLITNGSEGLLISSAAYPSQYLQGGTSGPGIQITLSSSLNHGSYWSCERINNPDTGVFLYNTETQTRVVRPTRYVAPNETRTLSELNLAYGAFQESSNSQALVWTSMNPSIATVDRSTGAVTGVAPGTVEIDYRLGTTTYYYYITVTEIPNGTYFLKNKKTNLFADIEGPTMANNQTIHQWSFHGYGSQKWVVTHVGGGYYSFRTDYTGEPYYLGLRDETAQGEDVVLRYGSLTNGMKWKIQKTASGAYKLIPKTGEANGLALATSTSDSTNGAKLIQELYVDMIITVIGMNGILNRLGNKDINCLLINIIEPKLIEIYILNED